MQWKEPKQPARRWSFFGVALMMGVGLAQAAPCTVDGGIRYQMIDGFGFSSAWCGTLSDAKNAALYDTLGMSILRVRIDQYGNWDDERNNASAAHTRGVTVLGCAWSPPPQWNSNGQSENGFLLPEYWDDYAYWLNDAANSIGLDCVSFQNEPDIESQTDWTGTQIRDWLIQHGSKVGRPMTAADSFFFDDAMTDPLLASPEASQFVEIISGHIYGNGLSIATATPWTTASGSG